MTAVLATLVLLLQAVISVHTELVTVPVIVTNARGQHVSGLGRENFRVFEDGQPRPIAVFYRGDEPVTLGLVVDRSQSMRGKGPALRATVSALLQASRPDDELFAVGFADDVSFALPASRPFTNDVGELETALLAMPAGGRTALYDGVADAIRHLQIGGAARRFLVVVSDGGDNASRETYREILARARQSDTVVYAVGLLGTPPVQEEEDAGLLERLCKDTGGLAYLPRSAEDITAASTSVARDIRGQYTLGFEPGARADRHGFRRIEVKVSVPGHGRLHVRTRPGYLPAEGKDDEAP